MANVSSDPFYAGYNFKNGYELNDFSDWYIPSQEELKVLKLNQDYVGGFSTQSDEASYWSSTELDSENAFALNFDVLMGNSINKSIYGCRIRPIREF